MEISEHIATVKSMHSEGKARGLFFQNCEAQKPQSRQITVDGRELISFSSCSYLSLEFHPKLIEGVKEKVDKYGTQFSASRGYISATPYEELEVLLSRLFGGYALVTSTTSLGHQSALGSLVTEQDAIVLDHQVHFSVQLAAQLTRANGAHVELVKHSKLDQCMDRILELSKKHRNVWLACDGVYSMYGDLAPINILKQILNVAPNVRLYVDDAHGMSWTGLHGRGSFLSRMPLNDRIIVATSLNKGFAAGGGCIIFPKRSERELVRMCGGPQLFSGPLQPPMLGAALASAKIHLSDEIEELQQQLAHRVRHCNHRLNDLGLPLLVQNEAPIFFVRMGSPKVACTVAQRMLDEGYFINVAMYPAVPMKRSGIRLALNASHKMEHIDGALDALYKHSVKVFREEGVSRLDLDSLFATALPQESYSSDQLPSASVHQLFPNAKASTTPTQAQKTKTSLKKVALEVEHYTTIHDVDKMLWDRTLGDVGVCSWEAMRTWEALFCNQTRKEHNWEFHYIIIKDEKDIPQCVTFFTVALNKDDMLMRDKVSYAVETRRQDDPYFLTSTSVMMGSLCSEGNHLYLNRSGPWREVLIKALETISDEYERLNASSLILRDLPDNDPELDAFLQEHGFIKTPMLDSHYLDIDWQNEEELLSSLTRRKRKHVKRTMIEPSVHFTRKVYGQRQVLYRPIPREELTHLHRLYLNVTRKKLRINVFDLPQNMLAHLQESPAWEIVTLTLDPRVGGPVHGRPVGFYAAHIHENHYTPFFCGLDYGYVESHGVYRQVLYQIVQRAKELGMACVHMGMDADLEKSRLGTRTQQNCIYAQVREHYHGALLREIVAEVGMAS